MRVPHVSLSGTAAHQPPALTPNELLLTPSSLFFSPGKASVPLRLELQFCTALNLFICLRAPGILLT